MGETLQKIGTHEGGDVLETVLASDTGARVSIINYGAAVRDWQVPVGAGRRSVVLGFDRFEHYPAYSAHCGAIAGRVANRIGGARFTLDGRDYVLPANEGPNHLHGGPRGTGVRLWQMERLSGEQAVRLSLVSPDGDMGYPGTLSIAVTYRLSGNRLGIDFSAETDAPTPVNLVQHNYFNLMGTGDVLDHALQVDAAAYTPTTPDLIPTGQIHPVAGTALDFRRARRLRDESGQPVAYDNNLVLDGERDPQAPAATLTAPDGSLTLRLWTDQPALQVYNSGKLDVPVPGLGGTRYQRFAGLCLEDQQFPDAINHPHFPSPVVTPEAPYLHRCAIEIG